MRRHRAERRFDPEFAGQRPFREQPRDVAHLAPGAGLPHHLAWIDGPRGAADRLALLESLEVGTRGDAKARRLFLRAPLHHHFELKGWHEVQVVTRFWILGILCAFLALSTLKVQ